MGRRVLLASTGVLVFMLAAAVAPAFSANQEVMLEHSEFIASRVAVAPGESVKWTNPAADEDHNVHFEDEAFIDPSPPKPGPWTTSRTFAAAGAYSYYCEIHGRPGGVGMSGIVYVNATGTVPPVATLDVSPGVAKIGETVTFSGSRSRIGDRPIVKHEWDLDGNGSFETDTGGTPSASRVYANSATLNIKLRLIDDVGLSSEATRNLRVTAAPTPSFGVSVNPALTGQNVNFDASFSSDSDGTVARYEWDLDGNGSFETDTGAPAASRSYTIPATLSVGLRVTDDDGVTAETTRSLQVNAAPRPAPNSPQPPAQPQPPAAPVTCGSLTGAKQAACIQRTCTSLSGPRRAACIQSSCRSLTGGKRAACVRKSCRSVSRSKRRACMRKSCRWQKGSKKRACLRKYARKR